MPLKREYFPSDTIKLINRSESHKVRGGARIAAADDDKHGAHTIGRHLIKGSAGALGKGIAMADFRDRFLDAPENISSAWAGKGEMAILLCELLNSDVGQRALQVMDSGVHRVVVHYFNQGKLAGLLHGAQFRESTVKVTPAFESIAMVPLMNSKTGLGIVDKNGIAKMIAKKTLTPKKSAATVKARDIVSVNAVLDRYGSAMHLQTFYPSSEMITDYCEWRVGGVSVVGTFSPSGSPLTKVLPMS